MEHSNHILFWDFDGTLGYRRDGMWGGALIEALREVDSGTSLTAVDFRPFLVSGFPWHDPHIVHTHIVTADQWWEPIQKKFEQGFLHFGYSTKQSNNLAKLSRKKFIQNDKWSLFDDVVVTLKLVASKGWKSSIISNHIPELIQIIRYLEIEHFFDHIINSADVGAEKPNQMIYEHALNQVGNTDNTTIWMIGDNIEADVFGAEVMGINSILVRNEDARAKRNCKNIMEVIEVIGSYSGCQ